MANRVHLKAGLFLAFLATVVLWKGCLLGEVPYDSSYQARFRPWRTPSTTQVSPNVSALAPAPDKDVLDRYRLYWTDLVHDDVVLSVWPDHLLVRQQVRAGALPLWNPSVLGGAPLFANGMSSPFFPASWPSYLLPAGWSRSLTLWLHLVLAGLALYAFLVDRGRSSMAAATGAAVYMLNPVFVGWLYYGSAVPVMGILPLVLIAIFRLPMSQKPWRVAAVMAALTGLELYAGNMQFVLYALCAQAIAGGYVVAKQKIGARLGTGAWLFAATGIGLLAASVVLLPFLELQSHAFRAPNKYADVNFLPPGQLLEYLFPRFYGHPGNRDYVGGFIFFRPYTTLFGGPGAVPLVLAIVGGAISRRVRPLALLALGGLAGLCLLAADPLHAVARAILPGFDSLDVVRALVLVHLVLAILAAEGIEALQEAPARAGRVVLVWLAVLFAAALALDAIGLAAGNGSRLLLHLGYLRRHGSILLAPRILWPLVAVALLGFGVRMRARAIILRLLFILPTLAVAFELVWLAYPGLRFAAPRDVLPPSTTVAELQRLSAGDPGRIVGLTEPDSFPGYSGDNLPPNTASALGLQDLRGYVPLPPAPMVELLTAAAGRPFAAAVTFRQADLPLFQTLGVRYVLSSVPPRGESFERAGEGLWRLRGARQAFFTPCVQIEPDARRRLSRLVAPDFEPFAAAWVDGPVPGVAVCTQASGVRAAEVQRPSPGQVRVRAVADTNGVLVLADAWFPGWTATVDSVPQEILRVDHALRGVVLPPGEHVVEFSYRPASLTDGALLSLVALLLIVGALFWERRPRLSDDLIVGIVAAVLLGAFAWIEPLPNDNDALYAGVMRALRESFSLGWLQVEGTPFLDKPPLLFWVGALLSAVFGESEFVLRLPSIMAGVAGVVLTTRIARRLSGSRGAGLIAGGLLLASPTYYEYARRVYMEVPVTVAVLLAFDLGLRERWKSCGIWTGIAFMCKSLPGVLGLVALAVAHLLRKRLPRGLWVAAGLALAVALPWHLLAYLRAPDLFLAFTLRLHVVDQIASAQPWSTGGPLFYASSMLENDPLLLAGLALGAGAALLRLRREPRFDLLAVLVAVVVQLVLYHASATKKPFYLLTMYPFVAVLAACGVAPWMADRRRAALAWCTVAASFVLLCGPLLRPDPSSRESTYLAPLARQAARLTPPGEPIYGLDVYLAAPQFYAHRPVHYAVRSAGTQAMLSRIPYLRFAQNVVLWNDQLLRGGKLVIAQAKPAAELLARIPGATIVARNEAFWLVRGPQ